MGLGEIKDDKLRRTVIDLDQHLKLLMSGSASYSFKKLIDYRDKIVKRFERYIKRRRKEIKGSVENYEITKKEVSESFKYLESNIISTFERNIIRAFGQAAHSIEKALGEQLSAPGAFGVRALLRLARKRPKLAEPTRVEGLSRLTRDRRLYRIDLIPYIMLLIRTAQMDWDRKLNEAIAYSTGSDLVRISPEPCWLGPKADEVCNRWRDKIVSLSGLTPGFPQMREATSLEKPPLFHPNCRHSYAPLTEQEQKIAIARKIKYYSTLKRHI